MPGGANAHVLEADGGAGTPRYLAGSAVHGRDVPLLRRAKRLGNPEEDVSRLGVPREKTNELETEDREIERPIGEKKDRGRVAALSQVREHQEDDEPVAESELGRLERDHGALESPPGARPGGEERFMLRPKSVLGAVNAQRHEPQ